MHSLTIIVIDTDIVSSTISIVGCINSAIYNQNDYYSAIKINLYFIG